MWIKAYRDNSIYLDPELKASTELLKVYGGESPGSFTVSQVGDGALSVSSSDTSVATATISGSTVTVTYVAAGTATITVTTAKTDTYKAASISIAAACIRSGSGLSLNKLSMTVYGGTGSDTAAVTSQVGDGALSVSSSNTSVATATISGSTITVTYVAAGTATITVKKAETVMYAAVSATISVTCVRTSVTIPSLASTSVAWSGSTVTVGVNNYNSNLMTQSGTVSANSAGSWTVTWTLKNTARYCWSDGSTGSKSASWSTYASSITFTVTLYHYGSYADLFCWTQTYTCSYGTTIADIKNATYVTGSYNGIKFGVSYGKSGTSTYINAGYTRSNLYYRFRKYGVDGSAVITNGADYQCGYVGYES